MLKRSFDLCVSLILVAALAPLFLILAVLIKRKLGSPVLFVQERPGRFEKSFNLLKFRTMTNDLDSDGKLLPNEKRLTRFGRLLRSTSMDELPSLINVIKGEMSLVGPRPLRVSYLPYYSDQQRRRHEVMPGITGYAQVNGRNTNSWEVKFDLDVWYVENKSFALDLKILVKTVVYVFTRKGVTPTLLDFEQPFSEYVLSKNNEAGTNRPRI